MFGKIRTMTDERGETFFVGKDVAMALGYSNTRDAMFRHVDEEDKTTVVIPDTGSNYKSRAVFINESGLYSLILSSKLPQAKAFKRWVTSEVLPQIRQTGGYIPTHDGKGRQLMKGVDLSYPCNYQSIQKTLSSRAIFQKNYSQWKEQFPLKRDKTFQRQMKVADSLLRFLEKGGL